ncbi:hypothetical protein mRhiFer1_009244 [Rhinolophus ferrumequinum]|uniref:Uncharacterized protein n=1 Tax=Rhinolophus ferrumequinum TaxID=59479 RepID=A0A7J7S8E6_RHIFE|nr:hypothetical protein mRhiFer1_009244 [Rhinolophus ferrumequinum]
MLGLSLWVLAGGEQPPAPLLCLVRFFVCFFFRPLPVCPPAPPPLEALSPAWTHPPLKVWPLAHLAFTWCMNLWALSFCRIKIAQACLALCLQLLGRGGEDSWWGCLMLFLARQCTYLDPVDLGFILETHILVKCTNAVLGAKPTSS